MRDIAKPIEPASLMRWGAPALFAPLLALALLPGAARGQAGYVHEIAGDVRSQNGSGAGTVAKVGDTFLQGTIFETGNDGRLVIKFEDGQIAALGPDTRLRVDAYRYDPRNARASSSALAVPSGASRVVTGLIGSTNRQALRLAAGTFNVHVRGTDVTLLADSNGRLPGQTVAVNLGNVLLETGHGSIYVGARQFSTMPTGQLPTSPAPITVAPAAVQATVNSLVATSLPTNLPVVVASAARAAAAEAQAKAAAAAAAADPANLELRTKAQAALSAAADAMGAAANQAAAAYRLAMLAGYLPPAPAVLSSPTEQALAPPLPIPTPPALGCTGSPC